MYQAHHLNRICELKLIEKWPKQMESEQWGIYHFLNPYGEWVDETFFLHVIMPHLAKRIKSLSFILDESSTTIAWILRVICSYFPVLQIFGPRAILSSHLTLCSSHDTHHQIIGQTDAMPANLCWISWSMTEYGITESGGRDINIIDVKSTWQFNWLEISKRDHYLEANVSRRMWQTATMKSTGMTLSK